MNAIKRHQIIHKKEEANKHGNGNLKQVSYTYSLPPAILNVRRFLQNSPDSGKEGAETKSGESHRCLIYILILSLIFFAHHIKNHLLYNCNRLRK